MHELQVLRISKREGEYGNWYTSINEITIHLERICYYEEFVIEEEFENKELKSAVTMDNGDSFIIILDYQKLKEIMRNVRGLEEPSIYKINLN